MDDAVLIAISSGVTAAVTVGVTQLLRFLSFRADQKKEERAERRAELDDLVERQGRELDKCSAEIRELRTENLALTRNLASAVERIGFLEDIAAESGKRFRPWRPGEGSRDHPALPPQPPTEDAP